MDADAGIEGPQARGPLSGAYLAEFFDDMVASLRRLDVHALPSTPVDSPDICGRLPPRTPGVYFLARPGSVLYIGKAVDLRGRWRLRYRSPSAGMPEEPWREMCHARLFDALELGDVRLHWWELPQPYIAAVESLLLQIHRPPWNCARG